MGFDTSAAAYERARPSYPPDAVRELVERLGIGPGRSVLDLAAGTGKLTRLLVPTGARIVAVEPSDPMRAQLEATVPGIDALPGAAEELPFEDSAFDAVVVAQAFHWFDAERALAEIHRVLRPEGGLGLAWNVRDRTVEWTQRLADLTEPYRGGGPKYRDGAWREAFETTSLFTPLEKREFPFEHEVDADRMVDRMASISWIAVLPDAERLPLLDRIRGLLDGMPERFPVPYHTEVWWCRAIN